MSELTRRRLIALAAATVAGGGLADFAMGSLPKATSSTPVLPVAKSAAPPPTLLLPPPVLHRPLALPGGGVLTSLPGDGDLLALTLDDGANTDVVRLYAQFAKDTGIRLTFFVNGFYPSWTDNRALLRPLVDSGQIQLGNHTWSHPDLTSLSASEVADQISRNSQFLSDNYGVNARPFFRPPYGYHDKAVRKVAADEGYRVTTMWNGSISDSSLVIEDFIVDMATKYFNPQAIVIGHLNYLPVTHVYGRLVDIIRSRALRTVTLNDVFK